MNKINTHACPHTNIEEKVQLRLKRGTIKHTLPEVLHGECLTINARKYDTLFAWSKLSLYEMSIKNIKGSYIVDVSKN